MNKNKLTTYLINSDSTSMDVEALLHLLQYDCCSVNVAVYMLQCIVQYPWNFVFILISADKSALHK